MAIDKAKGIICKPMPVEWHDRRMVNKMEDEEKRDFYRSIVADKKPYFMRYIYPALMKQYNTYIANTNKNALREFQMTVDELRELSYEDLTDRQKDFLRYYDHRMPVGVGNCVMNRICKRFEAAFDGHTARYVSDHPFDYTIMKNDSEYARRQYDDIRRLYEDYNDRLRSYTAFANSERIDEAEASETFSSMNDEFEKECSLICPDARVLCNIILDICYSKRATKRFAWSMCSEEIIHNLLYKNGNKMSYPVLDANGDIEFGGSLFSLHTIEIGENDNDNTEGE